MAEETGITPYKVNSEISDAQQINTQRILQSVDYDSLDAELRAHVDRIYAESWSIRSADYGGRSSEYRDDLSRSIYGVMRVLPQKLMDDEDFEKVSTLPDGDVSKRATVLITENGSVVEVADGQAHYYRLKEGGQGGYQSGTTLRADTLTDTAWQSAQVAMTSDGRAAISGVGADRITTSRVVGMYTRDLSDHTPLQRTQVVARTQMLTQNVMIGAGQNVARIGAGPAPAGK